MYLDFDKHDILPGAKIYNTTFESILFGCPPEILKFLLKKRIALPSIIVLPDTLGKFNSCQTSIEFLIYHFLFVQKGLARGLSLEIYTLEKHIANLKELVRVTLLGLKRDEIDKMVQYLDLKEDIDQEMLAQIVTENEYFAIKKDDGSVLQVDDLLCFIPFEIGERKVIEHYANQKEQIILEHVGSNRFTIQYKEMKQSCDLNFDTPQLPCYEINHTPLNKEEKTLSNIFSIRVLGASEGFDPYQPANGYLLRINSKWLLWDCPAYTSIHLQKIGLTTREVDAIFISHVHEDHLDIMQVILEFKKTKIYTTPEIFHCLLIKAMAVMECDYEKAKQYFDFYPIYPYRTNSLFGATFEIFYSVHVIPALGAKFTVPNPKENSESTLFISGDHVTFQKIEEMREKNLLSRERQAKLDAFIPKPWCNVNFIDAGKGLIHGNESEYKDSKAENGTIYFMHTRKIDSLPEGQKQLHHGQHIIVHE